MNRAYLAALLLLGAAGCGGDGQSPAPAAAPAGFVAVTFNTGIPQCARTADAAYSCEDADVAAQWYGTGLSFKILVEEARRFFDSLQPDLVAVQEMFYSGGCPDIPPEHHRGFVCEDYRPGDPSTVQLALGPGYQIACNPGKPDKCLAVKKSFGRWRGCEADLCLDHLAGARVADCGGGSRVGRGVLDRANGETLIVVLIHGTSGMTRSDEQCRVQQFEQVFVDLGNGSGAPAANGGRNLVLGDLNTDPGRQLLDASARAWNGFVGESLAFHSITDVGFSAEPTYAGLFNIDHVASDAYIGDCVAGQVTDIVAFDHLPIVCHLTPP
ncbi:hypothetical protein [Sinimarinibacterium flocculans]|uniref:hypothetical protein n=1 Tax=Sinimarinibacterium flocculans TaxID=985250 RepID=UPI0035184734